MVREKNALSIEFPHPIFLPASSIYVEDFTEKFAVCSLFFAPYMGLLLHLDAVETVAIGPDDGALRDVGVGVYLLNQSEN